MKTSPVLAIAFVAIVAAFPCAAQTNAELHSVAFSEVRSAMVSKITGFNKAAGMFHGFILAPGSRYLATSYRTELANLLIRRVAEKLASLGPPNDEAIVEESLCFDPGYAVHFETSDGPRDFSICLDCSFLEVYDGKGHEIGMSINKWLLTELKAAYFDEFILEEGLEKTPNQLPDPTSKAVTPPARAGAAPSSSADH